MRNILTYLMIVLTQFVCAQLPYSWTPGVNPGWTTGNTGSGNTLTWNAGCSVVTTNCTGQYSNNQNTTYTSPNINTTCASASSVNITFSASGNIESGYDFMFIEYSLNGGTTWINPYGAGTGWTGNFGAGGTIPAVTVPTSATFKFRFNFQSDFSNRSSGYKIYDFDIWCNTVLPIELLYFDVKTKTCGMNEITWSTATEMNNDYFIVEHSTNAIDFNDEVQNTGGRQFDDTGEIFLH